MCVVLRLLKLIGEDLNAIVTGDFFIPAFQCPHRVQRVGTLGDGGKWVCGLDRVAKQDKCVIYSFGSFHFRSSSPIPFSHSLPLAPRRRLTSSLSQNFTGINGESSFESTLLQRAPGCEVWGYDYSVNSVRTPSLSAELHVLTPQCL
jgi:hypothetical protein